MASSTPAMGENSETCCDTNDWSFYGKLTDDRRQVQCNCCNRLLSRPNGSFTAFRRHLLHVHKIATKAPTKSRSSKPTPSAKDKTVNEDSDARASSHSLKKTNSAKAKVSSAIGKKATQKRSLSASPKETKGGGGSGKKARPGARSGADESHVGLVVNSASLDETTLFDDEAISVSEEGISNPWAKLSGQEMCALKNSVEFLRSKSCSPNSTYFKISNWQPFARYWVKDKYVMCKLCNSRRSYGRSASNFRRHLVTIHKHDLNRIWHSTGANYSISSEDEDDRPAVESRPRLTQSGSNGSSAALTLQNSVSSADELFLKRRPDFVNKNKRAQKSPSVEFATLNRRRLFVESQSRAVESGQDDASPPVGFALVMCCICKTSPIAYPAILPCCHFACGNCVDKGKAGGSVTCTFCDKAYEASSMKNIPLDRERCFLCPNEMAVSFCRDCGDLLCIRCTDAHMLVKLTKGHQLVVC